jgi:ABC-type Mn/Zn transport systems, ATPase component
MALITLKGVCVAFENREVVTNASFRVEKGDYLVMLGENGSGKSTLMRAMLSLVRVSSGTITYGHGLTKNRIGYLPQKNTIARSFPASCEEVVLSGCCSRLGFHPFYNKAQRLLAREKMRLLDIEDLRTRSFRTLSGGQQQRVLLARALCATDSLILLDEPVTGLDPDATAELYSLLRRLNREHGIAVVMVSHDMHSALDDAKHIVVINHGVDFFGTRERFLEEEARA